MDPNEPLIPASQIIKFLREFEYFTERLQEKALQEEDAQAYTMHAGAASALNAAIDTLQEHIANHPNDT